MKKEKTDVFFLILFLTVLAHLTYVFVMKELAYQFSDYNGHVYVYLPNFLKRDTLLDAWKMVPYCAYHVVTLLF